MENEKTSRVRKPLPLNLALESGKIQPQAIDLEEAVLGALMLEKDAINDVLGILSPESFYKEEHQKIFSAILHLFHGGNPVDIMTVTEILISRGELKFVGGPDYISQLTNRVASSAHAEYHARIIQQKFILRELIRVGAETVRDGYDDSSDCFEALNKAEQAITGISIGRGKNYQSGEDIAFQTLKEMEIAGKSKEDLTGVPSGFTVLDRVTGGFQKSDLIILAARPAMGKSSLAMAIARNLVADFKKPVGVFSLEMAARQLMMRLYASETGINYQRLRSGKLEAYEWQQVNTAAGIVGSALLHIDDTPALNVYEFRRKARAMKLKHNVELIIVDYLQLMTADVGKAVREQEVSLISRTLKAVAKELDLPIIALSQLNRAVEGREKNGKRPQLSDLRESGAIEQEADLVAFIYRPEYYHLTEDEAGNSTRGLAEVIIAKHRNGPLETIALGFIESLAKFTDYSTDIVPPSVAPGRNWHEVEKENQF